MSNQNIEIGMWCVPGYHKSGSPLLHPDHHNSNVILYQRVFKCAGKERDFLTMQEGDRQYRIKSELICLVVPEPKFKIGDQVRTVTGTPRIGIIRWVTWHFKRQSPIYSLEENGRLLSKYYFDPDLVLENIDS